MARKSKRLPLAAQEPSASVPVYNVAVYLRLSNEENEKNVGTIEFQKQIILEYMKGKTDMLLYDIYCDDGKTGTNFDREGFQQMMYDIYNGKVNCIIVKDLSRFGREYIEMGEYVEKIFPLLGVRFIAVNDHVDNKVAPLDVSVPIKNVINALYAKDLSRKIASSFRMRQLNGDYIGGPATYGYLKSENDPHKLVVDPEAAKVVKMIYKWKLEGLGVTTICRMLVKMGISPPAKYKYEKGLVKSEKYAHMNYWIEGTVNKILTNEMYIGNMVQGKTKKSLYNGTALKRVDKENWIVVEGTHEAIISKEDFYAVQKMLEEGTRQVVRRKNKSENIFRSKLTCGECGSKLNRNGSKSGGRILYSYVCHFHSTYPDACSFISIKEEVLKNIVHQSIKMQIAAISEIDASMKRSANSPEVKNAMYLLTKQISETLSGVAYIKESRVNLAKDFAKQLLNEEEYDLLRLQFDMELTKAVERLEELEKQRCKFNRLFTTDKWIEELKQYSSSKKLTVDMVNAFIKEIKIYSDKSIEIEWKYKDDFAEYLELANGGVKLAG